MQQKLLRGLPLVLRLPVVLAKAPKRLLRERKHLLERLKELAVRHTHAMIIILVFALLFLMVSRGVFLLFCHGSGRYWLFAGYFLHCYG